MGNTAGQAYGLTLLCPIKQNDAAHSYANLTRLKLQKLPLNEHSPFAKVANTYMCRFYILNDVFYEGYPANNEHLKSAYLVFCCNFHGDRDQYLRTMWNSVESDIKNIWEYCITFDKVHSADDFVHYIQKCQVENTLYFNGSTDDSLAEQLKSLYLKQEFTQFAYDNYGKSAEELQKSFNDFIERTQPDNLATPTWQAGLTKLAS
jgi:hypothetical protein